MLHADSAAPRLLAWCHSLSYILGQFLGQKILRCFTEIIPIPWHQPATHGRGHRPSSTEATVLQHMEVFLEISKAFHVESSQGLVVTVLLMVQKSAVAFASWVVEVGSWNPSIYNHLFVYIYIHPRWLFGSFNSISGMLAYVQSHKKCETSSNNCDSFCFSSLPQIKSDL